MYICAIMTLIPHKYKGRFMVVKKKTIKRTNIKNRSHKMGSKAQDRTRLVISCTDEEKKYVKLLAAKNNMTMGEYLLSFAREQMPKSCKQHCTQTHIPNKETAKVLRDTDEGKNLEEYETLDEFWESLGLNKYAKT